MIKKIIRNLIPRDSFIFQWFYLSKAILANIVYGFPARDMICIGVTGTDGKTTTTNMIYHLLREQALPVCMSSSTHMAIKDTLIQNPTHKTSYDHFYFQRFLRQAKKKGCKYAVIETASHGIHQKRIWGIPYDIVLFTNISREHLDYHKDMETYKNVKKRLFEIAKTAKKKPGIIKTGIVNIDYKYANEFLEVGLPHKYAITKNENLDLPSNIKKKLITNINESEMTWSIRTKDKDYKCKLNIPGSYNMENATMALCVVEELKLDMKKAINDLETFNAVPGRMEIIKTDHPARIIIDYAVTPNAFKLTLQTLRKTTPGKLIHVFGATGDRDKEKRPILGEVSSNICDLPVITDEEPYSEKVEDIMEMIAKGCEITGRERINFGGRSGRFDLKSSYAFIPDREKAIAFAMHLANSPTDTIVITGMGDLTTKTVGNKYLPWSDREIIIKIAKESNKE